MSQQTIVAVAITLAVVVRDFCCCAALAAWSFTVAMTRGKPSHSLCGCLHRRLGAP